MAKAKSKPAEGKTRGAGRSRTWAAMLYPESAKDGWRDILNALHIAAYISPLHDKDVNPDGEPKKAHWHILLNYESVKSKEQVAEVWDAIGAVPEPSPVNSLRGYARYLCHLDNPEKAQYDPADVICMGGADYQAAIALPTDDLGTTKAIIDYVRHEQVHSFAELIDRIMDVGRDDWFAALYRNSGLVMRYMQAAEWERKEQYVRRTEARRAVDAKELKEQAAAMGCDPKTGEILDGGETPQR